MLPVLSIPGLEMSHQMEHFGIDAQISHTVLAYTQSCAEQLRLQLYGGWPWETAQTAWKLYRILHPDSSLPHRIFKRLTLLASLFTSPKLFYRAQRTLSESEMYRRTRARLLPIPEMQHLKKELRKH
jgi:hypothetical protein